MSRSTNQFVSALRRGWPLRAGFAVAALVGMAALIGIPGAQASLIVPDLPEFVIEETTSTSAASSGPADSAPSNRGSEKKLV